MSEWESKRQAAAARRRRVIFNNDGDDVLLAQAPTREAFLAQRCSGLENTHVDTCVYSTLANFDRCVHDSRVGQIDGGMADALIYPDLIRANHTQALIGQGHDSLSLVIGFCRESGIEVFWSARMNDMHDNWHPPLWTAFKKNHPELRLWREGDYGRPGDGVIEPHMYFSAMDYGQAEVRQRQFAIIMDVCERYDVDGIELDFMREPVYFRPTMEGRAVESEHLDVMTEYVRSLREAIDGEARRKGRPILLSARIPGSLRACRYIGLDAGRWLREGLLDFVIASIEFAPFTGKIDSIVSLAHSHGIQAYAGLSGSVGGPQGWAAAAANALAQGADGIATFNAFDPHAPAWRVIGDVESIRRSDRHYALDDFRAAMSTHEHVLERDGMLPMSLADGFLTVKLPAHLPQADGPRAGLAGCEATLTVVIEECAPGDELEMRLNGEPLAAQITISTSGCAPRAVGTITWVAPADPALLVAGDNEVTLSLAAIEPRKSSPRLGGLQLRLRAGEPQH